jgi:hypothetical protein
LIFLEGGGHSVSLFVSPDASRALRGKFEVFDVSAHRVCANSRQDACLLVVSTLSAEQAASIAQAVMPAGP